ncbi:MAG: GTP-binding protein [Thermomicrobiales bacterium]
MIKIDQNRIPVTVIGGYLGAGKTTLLNNLLHQNQGRRIAVLVNDFGAVNIDVKLIVSHDGDTISLANGCVCCSLASGFHTVMASLLERDPPLEQVIVEASGVAIPHKIGQYGHMHGFRLDGVMVLIDVETIRARARDRYVGKTVIRQLQGADLLVLTKTDLVTPEQTDAVRDWLRALVPDARVVAADQGRLPLAITLDLGAAPASVPAENSAEDFDHPHDYDSVTICGTGPVAGNVFSTLSSALPEGVLRGKGIVWLAEEPERRGIFQVVGTRWSLKLGEPWGDQPPRTDVLFIGIPGSIDREYLEQLFYAQTPTTSATSVS